MKIVLLFLAAYTAEITLLTYIIIHYSVTLFSAILMGIVIIVMFLTVAINISVWVWKEISDECDVELTYAEFENLYSIMPEKFKLREDDIEYNYNTTTLFPGYKTKRIHFKTYLDYCKYKKFYIKYSKIAKETKRQEQQKEFINLVQQELESRKNN